MAKGHPTWGRLGIMGKALTVPAFLVAVLVAVGGVTIYSQQGINEEMRYVTDRLNPASEAATEVVSAFYRERIRANTYLDNPSGATASAWEKAHSETGEAIAHALGIAEDAQRTALFQRMQQKHQRFGAGFGGELVPLIAREDALVNRHLRPLATEITFILEDLADAAGRNENPVLVQTSWQTIQQVLETHAGVLAHLSTRDRTDESADVGLTAVVADHQGAAAYLGLMETQVRDERSHADLQEAARLWRE